MTVDRHWLAIELQRLNWARELTAEVIQDIVASAGFMEWQAGQVVIELNSDVQSIFIVITGRLEGAVFDRLGKEVHRDAFQRGSVLGLFSALMPDPSHMHVEAAEHTRAIHLGLDDLLRLMAKHREFQLTMLRVAADLAKRLVMVDRDLPKPAAVAVVHHSDASRPLAAQLARLLRQLGESPCVAGDDARWRPEEGIPHRLIFEDGVLIGSERIKQLLKEWVSRDRLFVDFRTEHSTNDLCRMLDYTDAVLWCLRPQDVEAALQTLKAVEPAVPRLREKVSLVWVLDHNAPAPPTSGSSTSSPPATSRPTPGSGRRSRAGCSNRASNALSTICGACASAWPSAGGRRAAWPTWACSKPSNSTGSSSICWRGPAPGQWSAASTQRAWIRSSGPIASRMT